MNTVADLWFDYTPKFKGNRDRPNEAQCTVTLADFTEFDRIEAMKKLSEALPDRTPAEIEKESFSSIKLRVDEAEAHLTWSVGLVKKHFLAIKNLSVRTYGQEAAVAVTDFDSAREHAPDLLVEIAGRLVYGPDEDEKKD